MARQIRSEAIRVRLTKSEFAALTALSDEVGLSVSETLRRLAREASGLGPSFSGAAAHGLAANVAQLRKAGVNLNQITRALNSGRTPGYGDLKGGIERLARLVAQQANALEAMCVRTQAKSLAKVKQNV
ncbi:MobC family plasmid mobilization relaxosome protein [Agrobacterium tumefaciens]|uniref:plasmid mobilization protein n=1 Tax=Agrobacterium tumefaciens TaxID=358 RepID=UPI00157174A9|nr:MobC family plasmid mobilization relaxosome protein [Agrobacterium tumefaciens]